MKSKPKPQPAPRSQMREDVKLVLDLAESASDTFDKGAALTRIRPLLEAAPEMVELLVKLDHAAPIERPLRQTMEDYAPMPINANVGDIKALRAILAKAQPPQPRSER